jgi:hypothetical protein
MMNKCLLIMLVGTLFLSVAALGGTDQQYACGTADFSEDGKVNLADITYLISYVYLDGSPPPVPELANVNGSPGGSPNLADITRLICLVYLDGCQAECPCFHREIRGDCVTDPSDAGDKGHMVLEVINGNLHVHHIGAFYQCCLGYVVEYDIGQDYIFAVEADTGLPCDCICPFDLESVVYNLPEGEYEVTLVGICGDTIGVDTVQIIHDYGIIDYQYSGCIHFPTLSLAEDIVYTYSGDTLTMEHHDAFYNCGAEIDGFIVAFQQAGDTLRFLELNMMKLPMYCMCYYEISAAAVGIAPGLYVAEIYGQDGFWMSVPVELLDRRMLQLGD